MYSLHAPSDVLAGLTVGIMLVPQGEEEGRDGGREGLESVPMSCSSIIEYSTCSSHTFFFSLLSFTGMAYAVLSSLPPIYGLYASTIAGYVRTLDNK
jgi:MFS superfamily sulfate permease-like transporter